jgi:hypothetical protein
MLDDAGRLDAGVVILMLSVGDGRALLELGTGFEQESADALLRGGVGDRLEQRERTSLAVDGTLPCRKRHVPTCRVLKRDHAATAYS